MLGQLLHGRYQVVQVLSVGTFCQTYLARDTYVSNYPKCVVKHFKASNQRSESLQIRGLFTREVQALEKLGSHDQVAKLLDHFADDQDFYLVQEYVVGHPLTVELQPDHIWTESKVIQLLQEVLGILDFVHSQGLIHRDIKPSNLIRRPDDRLVLIDFGSVKQIWTQVVTVQGRTSSNFTLGVPATIAIGTPGYMPTEQGRGRPRPNSDVYALGMVAIQALTGLSPAQLLEDADTGELMWRQHAQVSTELANVIDKMVQYHFKDRYQSAQEVLQALQIEKVGRWGDEESVNTGNSQQFPPSLNGQRASSFNGGDPRTRLASEEAPATRRRCKLNHSISLTPKGDHEFLPSPHLPISAKAHSPSPNKPALVIGILAGVASALALIVGSFYFLRPSAPGSQFQGSTGVLNKSSSLGISLAKTLTGHTNVIWSVAISPDQQTLVSSSGDQTIKVWNLQTGQLKNTLTGHDNMVLSVAISPDGQTLASSSWDRTLKIWNLQTGRLRSTLPGRSKENWSIAISPDSQVLVSGSGDNNQIWALRTGRLLHNLSGHSGAVWSVAISPVSDSLPSGIGQTLVSSSKDKTIKIWNLRTGQLKSTLTGHAGRVRAVAISPNGETLASGSWDKTIRIWNLRTGQLKNTLYGHSGYVNAVAISPNGQILASGSDDYTIKLWSMHTGELVSTLPGHAGNVNSIAFTADGKTLVSGSGDGTIKIWRLTPSTLSVLPSKTY